MDDTPDILFSPEDGIIDRIMEKVLSAQEAADIVVFLIGSKRAANALIKAHAKGVSVRMIIDGKVARSRYSQHRFLVKKGIEVKTVKVRGGSLHSKFDVAVTGDKNHYCCRINLQNFVQPVKPFFAAGSIA